MTVVDNGTSAITRFVRISPFKLRLVADQVRGLPVGRAINVLQFSKKKAAFLVHKTLYSAIANAEHNDNADIDNLRVAEICIDAGPVYKRLRPRARGRSNQILKRTSHIRITVAEQRS
ncbi:MAG: 50S ribosomal protein L22 [Candidatus Eutrophobiaceae bacterium]